MDKLDNAIQINALIAYIESNVCRNLSPELLEGAFGQSYDLIRKMFRKVSSVPLKRYVNSRKIAHAAFRMQTRPGDSAVDIAEELGFSAYDTFTRAFKRETGITPSQFRRDYNCGAVEGTAGGLISMGVYGPVFSKKLRECQLCHQVDEQPPEKIGECILYGIPKVSFAEGKCTPFPGCLEKILQYMGITWRPDSVNIKKEGMGEKRGGSMEPLDYTFLMAASGASFRLRWHRDKWDGGSVDLAVMDSRDAYAPHKAAMSWSGLQYKIIEIEDKTCPEWEDKFIQEITASIDKGIPVIAIGIAGPPEACIISGYKEDGRTLTGWSYFQDNPEFSHGISFEDNGYFALSNWWESPFFKGIIVLGDDADKNLVDQVNSGVSVKKQLFKEAYAEMALQKSGEYLAGQCAYEAWAAALENDEHFIPDMSPQELMKSLLCQIDGETVLSEGRYWTAKYFEREGKTFDPNSREKRLCAKVSAKFSELSHIGQEMTRVRDGFSEGPDMLHCFGSRETRRRIASLVRDAKYLEQEIMLYLRELIGDLPD